MSRTCKHCKNEIRLECGEWRDDSPIAIASFCVVGGVHEPEEAQELTFNEFQRMSAERSRIAFPTCADWTLNDWAVALAGEVGEMCNNLKKDKRGLTRDERFDLDGPYKEEARDRILEELADVVGYSILMMDKLNANAEFIVLSKFQQVSARVGYTAPCIRRTSTPEK